MKESKEKKDLYRKKLKKSKIAPDFKSRTIDKKERNDKMVREKAKSALSNKPAGKGEV